MMLPVALAIAVDVPAEAVVVAVAVTKSPASPALVNTWSPSPLPKKIDRS
jgi:hypothetical protein